jgi:hypothetical protein
MNPLFDSAGLALVAYADVAAAGTSTVTNSGVTTTKTATGTYNVILPADKTQDPSRDLIFVQPKGTGQKSATVVDSSSATKVVEMYAGGSLADGEFDIIILRTIVPPPAGAPA